jgi:hypothetical protein
MWLSHRQQAPKEQQNNYQQVWHRLLLLLITMSMLTAPLRAEALPAKLAFFSAKYDASIKGIPITATREFKAESATHSTLNFTATSWLASMVENSDFSWEAGQIKPIEFKHERTIMGKEQRKTLSFDWPNKQIDSVEKDKRYTILNPEQALDHLSFQLQLQYDLLLGKEALSYRVADKDRIKEFRFEIVDRQAVINTKLGELNTIKIKVIRDSDKRVTYIWFALDWNHLLVKLEQYEDGKKDFDLQLTSAVIDGNPVSGRHPTH